MSRERSERGTRDGAEEKGLRGEVRLLPWSFFWSAEARSLRRAGALDVPASRAPSARPTYRGQKQT